MLSNIKEIKNAKHKQYIQEQEQQNSCLYLFSRAMIVATLVPFNSPSFFSKVIYSTYQKKRQADQLKKESIIYK